MVKYRSKRVTLFVVLILVPAILIFVLVFADNILDKLQKDEITSTNDSIKVENRFKGNPLFIIDGIEIDTLKNIDATKYQQIEYMEKDLAIECYGSKGKNGAVILTTKKE